MARRNEVAANSKAKAPNSAQVNKRPKAKTNGHQLPEKLPEDEILTDSSRKQWRLGKSIGIGGFGEIYSASDNIGRPVPQTAEYVIKIEPHENGPLFTETHFYIKAGKPEMIEAWKAEKRMKFLGMPKMSAFGSHMYLNVKYRFMVMDRYGVDVQRIFESSKRKLSLKSAYSIAIKLIDVLEYIHSTGYVHADIKGSNLLLGYNNANEVYLVDYGLAYRYMVDNKHKVYEEDPRRAHDGTIEFTSRDAHVGAHSRRGDMEILAYNIIQWLCGRLPWEDFLKDQVKVHQEKIKFYKNIPKSLKTCFKTEKPLESLESFVKYVAGLSFEEQPNYDKCKKFFISGLKSAGLKDDGKLELKYKGLKTPKARSSHSLSDETDDTSPPKVKKSRIQASAASSVNNNHKAASTARKPVASTSNSKRLAKSKTNSHSATDLSSLGLAPGEVPTPAMLMIIQKRLNQQATNANANVNNKSSSHKVKKTNSTAATASATNAAASNSDDSAHEEFFTPPTTRSFLRRGKKRTSSLSNISTTPELF